MCADAHRHGREKEEPLQGCMGISIQVQGCEKILVNVTVRVLATSISGVSSTVLHRLKALTAL